MTDLKSTVCHSERLAPDTEIILDFYCLVDIYSLLCR
jgi:hypothetical protein